MRRLLIPLVILSLVTLGAATTVVPMSVERLTRASSDVVQARALESWSAWDAQHARILTYTRFTLLHRIKGTTPRAFVVKQLGGSAGGYTQHVAGVRHFRAGEEDVLFLHPSIDSDGTLVVTGLMQGNFRVVRMTTGAAEVTNGVAGVQTYNPGSRDFGAYRGSRMRLTELETRVRAVQR